MNSQSDKLGALPEEWLCVKLNEIGELLRGVSYTKAEAFTIPKDKYLPVLRAHNISRKINLTQLVYVPAQRVSSEQRILKNDIVIAMSSGSKDLVGKAAQSDRNYDAGFGAFCALVRLSREINRKFFGYYFQSPSYKEKIAASSSGVNINNLRREHIELLDLPFPPLPEQERIVTKLEELLTQLEAGVEELLKAQAQLKRYRQAVLKAAVTGELTREWREVHKDELEPASELLSRILKERRVRWESDQLAKLVANGKATKNEDWKRKYDDPISPDATALPQLPNGWTWATMPQLGELNRGKSKHRPRNAPHLYNGDYPFIQTGDIRRASGLLRQYSQTYSEAGLKQSRLWPKGTLCITIAANIAETAILGFDACFPDSVVGFRAEFDSCDVRFVDFFIRTAKQNLERYAPATAQKNINIEILSDVAVPFPPLLEQRQIADEVERILSITDASEETIAVRLSQAERLRQSIIKQAFEGKLVAQDPNDEPAELLLERIKLERRKREAEKAEAKSNRKRFTKSRPKRTERPAA